MFKNHRRCAKRYNNIQCIKASGHSGQHVNAAGWRWDGPQREIVNEHISEKSKLPHKQSNAIKAWRWWAIGPRGILQSITSEALWTSAIMTTRIDSDTGKPCRVTAHNPIHGGTIPYGYDWGVYSYKNPGLLFEHNPSLMDRRPLVLGKVTMDAPNQVIEHQYGYRAQRVRILSLTVFYEPRVGGEARPAFWKNLMEQRYRCPVDLIAHDKLTSWSQYYSEEEL